MDGQNYYYFLIKISYICLEMPTRSSMYILAELKINDNILL